MVMVGAHFLKGLWDTAVFSP